MRSAGGHGREVNRSLGVGDQLDAGVSALRDNRCGCFPDRIFANWRLADDRLWRRRLGMRQIGRHSRVEHSERRDSNNEKFHSVFPHDNRFKSAALPLHNCMAILLSENHVNNNAPAKFDQPGSRFPAGVAAEPLLAVPGWVKSPSTVVAGGVQPSRGERVVARRIDRQFVQRHGDALHGSGLQRNLRPDRGDPGRFVWSSAGAHAARPIPRAGC